MWLKTGEIEFENNLYSGFMVGAKWKVLSYMMVSGSVIVSVTAES